MEVVIGVYTWLFFGCTIPSMGLNWQTAPCVHAVHVLPFCLGPSGSQDRITLHLNCILNWIVHDAHLYHLLNLSKSGSTM